MKMRKFLAILCVIAMLCSIAPVVSAEETSTEIWSGSATGGSTWWDWVLDVTVDGTVLTEGGYISIYSDIVGNFNLILIGEKNGWAQVKPEHEGYTCEEVDGGYVTMIPYATMLDIYDEYGATDLSDVTKFTIYSSTGTPATISMITYTIGELPEPEPEPEPGSEIAILDKNADDDTYPENYVFSVSDWLPEYAPGDEVTVTVKLESNVFFNGILGVNAIVDGVGTWTTTGQVDSVNNKAVFEMTCVPNGDFQVQLWWTNEGCTGVKITNISIVKAGCQHDYTNQTLGTKVSDATCTEAAKYYVACDKCGADSETVVSNGNPLGHDMTEADCENAAACKRDDCDHTEGESLGHDMSEADCENAPACKREGCDHTAGEALGHSWTEATCTDPKTCSVCGATEGDPVGHKDEEPKDYTCDVCQAELCLEHDWADATCDKAGYCKNCGDVNPDAPALGHEWVEATCTDPKTCSVCEKTEGEALGHTWVDATCTAPKTCSVCEKTEGEALGHKWADATCTDPKTCSVCEKTEGEALGHKWVDADCEHAKTCSVCKATEGEALGHKWTDATCTDPATCSVCKSTKGEANGHKWDDGVVTKEATTEAAGEKTHTCSVCKSTKTSSIPKLPAPGGSTTVIYTGDTAVPSGWQMAVQVYAKAWEGPLDGAIFTEGGHVAINLTCTTADIWSAHVVLQGTGSANGWQQIDKDVATFTANADGSYTVTVTYDDLVKAYGGSDFSDLGCFYVYVNTADGNSVTVSSVEYIVPGTEQDKEPEQDTESDKITAVDTPIFTGEAAATGSWTIIAEVLTTPFEGAMDPSIVNEDGYISVYYTGTSGQIYLALQDGTNWGWYQIDAPSATTEVEGGYVSTFSYADLAKAYGKEDFSDLGKIIIGSANADDIVISQIAWSQSSSNAETGDDTMILLAVVLMAMMAACMVTTVSLKKRG